jgi:hypothetical protein
MLGAPQHRCAPAQRLVLDLGEHGATLGNAERATYAVVVPHRLNDDPRQSAEPIFLLAKSPVPFAECLSA